MDLRGATAALPGTSRAAPHDHVVLFYEDGHELAGEVGRELGEAAARPGGPGARQSARTFAGTPQAAGEARRFVAETLGQWGCPGFSEDAVLVVSELATNAVVHARSGFTVTVAARPHAVRISVRDMSGALPTRRQPSETDRSGRGLRLVSSIAWGWGAKRLPDGKVVWAELRSVV